MIRGESKPPASELAGGLFFAPPHFAAHLCEIEHINGERCFSF